MILEELNFLARHKFESIKEVKDYKENLEKQLPKLKGIREDLWRKYHRTTNEEDKATIKNEINELTEKIDTIQAHKNACIRIINRYEIVKEEYKKELETIKKSKKIIYNFQKNKAR
jgi:chromosome segregation ATPase